MGEVQFFLTKIVKATVARLGVLSILLLPSPPVIDGQQSRSVSELLRQFQGETVFWRQFEVATAIVSANDTTVLPQLEPWLTHEDRELRGNAAFIFARLGDSRQGICSAGAVHSCMGDRAREALPDIDWGGRRRGALVHSMLGSQRTSILE